MARRGLTGQLNMFDLYNSLEAGEVEMVSLVPDFEEEPEDVEEPEVMEEPEVVEEPEVEETLVVAEEPVIVEEVEEEKPQLFHEDEKVAMSRSYIVDGERIEIAYINYNKVRITKGEGVPVVKTFESTKEAVDYYVEQMQELERDE